MNAGVRKWITGLVCLAYLVVAPEAARPESAVPVLSGRVVDQAGLLDQNTRNEFEQILTDFEKGKGVQLVVLTVQTSHPLTIEQFAMRVAEQWALGRKGVDDGVLLVVAAKDRAVRIEVGYGLEGAVPDVLAKRIIEEQIIPHFRRGDYRSGIQAGLNALMALISGESLPKPIGTSGITQDGLQSLAPGLIMSWIIGSVIAGTVSVLVGALAGAVVALAFSSVYVGVGLGLLLAALVFFFLLQTRVGTNRSVWSRGRHWGGSRGGFGGGFSGGGGRFGGGGASGRW